MRHQRFYFGFSRKLSRTVVDGWMGKRGKQRERYHRAPREEDSGKIVYNSLDVIQKETTAMIRRIDVAERGLFWTDV